MSAGRLIGALSSLLLLILLVGLPTSEAIKCARGGVCSYRLGDGIAYASNFQPDEECPDFCYSFTCHVDGNGRSGQGCKKQLKTVCPMVTNANMAKLKDVLYAEGPDFFSYACKAGDCIDIFNSTEKTLAMLGPVEREAAKAVLEKKYETYG